MNKLVPIFTGEVKDSKVMFYDKSNYQLFVDTLDGQQVDVVIVKHRERRTDQQNKAIHLYFTQVAEALNDAGLTLEKVVKNFKMEHEWSSVTVKELLWREAQKYAVNKYSTTELDKFEEIEKVYDIVNRFLASIGVESIPFPSVESENESLKKKIG